ncbi:MAG: transglycosylase SLT domain-containing protein [Anaerolineaceae bacterium]|nr:transglycosylase SLT domain-containing protein [Anaerolineaceae bacterium]MCB9101417.1 transglycosylase SLT domain-containing protein [Anaerolineales bacterium]
MSPPSPSLVTIPFPDQSDDLIVIQLSTRSITLAVDEMVTIHITISNAGQTAALFDLEVLGLNPDWLIIPDLKLTLQPGQRRVVPITIKPPRLPGSRAGVHHFAVKATSLAYPNRYCQQRATLTIRPYFDFLIEALTPRQQALTWFKPAAEYELTVTNTSNISTRLALTGSDRESLCHFEFELPGETALANQIDLLLLPAETVSIPLRVSPTIKPWLGLTARTHHFTLTTSLRDETKSRSVLGQLDQKPLAGPGLMALLICGLVILGAMALTSIRRTAPAVTQAALSNTPVASGQEVPPLLPTPMTPPEPPPELPLGEEAGYEPLFRQIAAQYELDWRVLEAIAYRESHMNPYAVGQANDLGLMQVIPSTWNEWAPQLNVSDPFDPYSNILVAAAYLAHVRDFCYARGYREPQWMLIAYNWGPAQLDLFLRNGGAWGDIPLAQRQYALVVLDHAARRGLSEAASQAEFYALE